MVSLQALSEYAQRAQVGDTQLTCDATSSVDGQFLPSWTILPENALVLQSIQVYIKYSNSIV